MVVMVVFDLLLDTLEPTLKEGALTLTVGAITTAVNKATDKIVAIIFFILKTP